MKNNSECWKLKFFFCFQVKNGEDDFGWGAVVNVQKKANQSKVSKNLFLI